MTSSADTSAPVFVFGALRSGTTMFRLMLNSHKRIGNPGEVDFLFDFLHPDPMQPTGWRYDIETLRQSRIFRAHALELPTKARGLDLLHAMVDQFHARGPDILTMNVHRNAPRIRELLPDARFIHLLRDPRDVARSSTGMGWVGDSYFGVDHWVETERGWDEIASQLRPDQAMSLQFESLMADIDGELRRVCAFLGVPFSPEMLDYHLHSTYGPPDARIAEQWRRKATPREIALIEGKCGDLIISRGYTPNGAPAVPGPIELARIAIRSRACRWQGNIRRFGLPLFLTEKLARASGSRRLRAAVKRRMDERIIEILK